MTREHPHVVPTHSTTSVADVDTQIVGANGNRKYLLLVNDSDAVVYISVGTSASMNNGIRLEANGGTWEVSVTNGNLITDAVNGIRESGLGDKLVLATEG